MAEYFFNHRSWAKKWKESAAIYDCNLLKDL
jgi:hypothetical protein